MVFDCNLMLKHINEHLDGMMLEITVNNILHPDLREDEEDTSKNEENELQMLLVVTEEKLPLPIKELGDP